MFKTANLGGLSTNPFAAFSYPFSTVNEAATKWNNNLLCNGVESSPDKNNVQSAVLGMLSLSQQSHQLPLHYSYNNAATVTRQNNFDNEHIISPTGSESRHGSAALILTPPGSPQEERSLIITSPAEESCKPRIDCVRQQSYNAANSLTNHHTGGHLMNAVDSAGVLNDFASSTSQQYSLAPFLAAAECLDASAVSLALGVAAGGQMQSSSLGRQRSRNEKRPIPVDQKDDKYFERRRRNNAAAKKSRDTRKQREDEIALRAACLEKENAILRAQLGTLREEAQSLRHLLLQKRQRQMQMQMQMNLQQTPTMSLG